MASSPAKSSYEVVCPHCRKTFEAELLSSSGTAGPRGFKCPHCRLFVPYERADVSPSD
jgi:tRNA(Ile2) C34 agmatinyltransferase TiaS